MGNDIWQLKEVKILPYKEKELNENEVKLAKFKKNSNFSLSLFFKRKSLILHAKKW